MNDLRTKTVTPIACECGFSAWMLALDGPAVIVQCINCRVSWVGLLKPDSAVSCMGQVRGKVLHSGIEFAEGDEVN